jgi:hypothetical protein
MNQVPRYPGFLKKLVDYEFEILLFVNKIKPSRLEGDRPAYHGVQRPKNLAHISPAKGSEDLIPADGICGFFAVRDSVGYVFKPIHGIGRIPLVN